MGYFDYLKHGRKMFRKRGELPVYLVYFITDACNAKCKHCLLADGAHPGWEEPSMVYRRQELSREETYKALREIEKHYKNFSVQVETTVSKHNEDVLIENYEWFRRNLDVDTVFTLLTRGAPKEPLSKFFDVEKYEAYAAHMEKEYKSGSLSGYDHFPFADFINAKRIVRHRLIAKVVRTNQYQIPCYAGNLGGAQLANGDD